MTTDAIRAALEATQEAWAAANDGLPDHDADLRAGVLSALDTASLELEQALNMTGVLEGE